MQEGFLKFLEILKSRLPFFRGRCPLHPRSCGGLFLLRRAFSPAEGFYRFCRISHILSQSPSPSQSFCEKSWLNPLLLPKKVEFTLYFYIPHKLTLPYNLSEVWIWKAEETLLSPPPLPLTTFNCHRYASNMIYLDSQ